MDEGTIARLVLGYLREEGCRAAYKDFIKTSQYLRTSNTKYVPSRFFGLTLSDIMKEYYEIYQIVQARLEATNYFKENHPKVSLSEQLIYLLNTIGPPSRMSTPCPRSPSESYFNQTSPMYVEHISDIEATPAHELPGNVSYEGEVSSKKKKNKVRQPGDIHVTSVNSDEEVFSYNVMQEANEIVAQILERKEFPEKLAQTINKNIIGTETEENTETSKETTKYPVYDKILEEIIGEYFPDATNAATISKHSTTGNNKSTDQNENCNTGSRNVSKSQDHANHVETSTDESIDKRVEEQNAEAIRCIIDTRKTTEAETQTSKAAETDKSEITVFDGNLDKYLVASKCHTPVNQQQTSILLNINGSFLMVPPTPTPVIPQTSGNYYIVNKPPLMNVYTPAAVTERDILTMPTIILSENKSSKIKSKKEKTVLPKQNVIVSIENSMSEFLTVHKGLDDPQNVPTSVNNIQKDNTSTSKEVCQSESSGISANNHANTNNCREIMKKNVLENHDEINNIDCRQHVSNSNYIARSKAIISEIFDNSVKPTIQEKNKPAEEPAGALTTPIDLVSSEKSTPKSGSHVRNLDFSTPLKVSFSQNETVCSKINTEIKKQASKKLFKKKENTKTAEVLCEANPWDANLRVFAKTEETEIEDGKRKASSKQKGKASIGEKGGLNTTEHDAALLEAALKTPVKSEVGMKNEFETVPKSEKILKDTDLENCGLKCEKSEMTKKKRKTSSKPKNIVGDNERTDNDATILDPHKAEVDKNNEVEKKSQSCLKEIGKASIDNAIDHTKKAKRACKKKTTMSDNNASDITDNKIPVHKKNIESKVSGNKSKINQIDEKSGIKKNNKKIVKSKIKTKIKNDENLNKTRLSEVASETTIKSPIDKVQVRKDSIAEKEKYLNNKEAHLVGENNISLKDISEHLKTKQADRRNLISNSHQNEQLSTPEDLRESLSHPMNANRNIIPMLETPVKRDVPKTPGIGTPCDLNISSMSIFTPVGKMLAANLSGFDINLPTPNIPISSNFPPFTPTIDLLSPYSNRPTDYSTSSSYYQPSDSEQNKSLEAQLFELEKKACEDKTQENITNENLKAFNKNIVGKKNLDLLKTARSTDVSSSSSDTSSSSEDEDENSCNSSDSEYNDTIICKKVDGKSPRKSYPLRSRNAVKTMSVLPEETVSTEMPIEAEIKEKSDNKIPRKSDVNRPISKQSIEQPEIVAKNKHVTKINSGKKLKSILTENFGEENIKQTKSEIKSSEETEVKDQYNSKKNAGGNLLAKDRLDTALESVKDELEAKRLRTIKRFKHGENNLTFKPKKQGYKSVANLWNQRKRPRKSDSPRKHVSAKIELNNSVLNVLKKDLDCSDQSESENELSLSEKAKIPNEPVNKSPPDVEAQNLIEGLKERGIHLMHNKNTKTNTLKTNMQVPQETEIEKVNVSDALISDKANDTGPELNYSEREEFDTCLITDEICIKFSESVKKTSHTILNSNVDEKLKNIRARLFIDEINEEVDIEFKVTNFQTLLDINTSKTCKQKESCSNKMVSESSNESTSPISSKKRKHIDDEESTYKEKKLKTLLNSVTVDSILNNIHGNQ